MDLFGEADTSGFMTCGDDDDTSSNTDSNSASHTIDPYTYCHVEVRDSETDWTSNEDPAKVYITVDNQSSEDVTMHWRSFEGDKEQYATVSSDVTYTQGTYNTHVWILSGSTTGDFAWIQILQNGAQCPEQTFTVTSNGSGGLSVSNTATATS